MVRERPDWALSAKINNPTTPTSAKLQAMLDAGPPIGNHELSGWGTSLPIEGGRGMIEAERNNRRVRLSLWIEGVSQVHEDATGTLQVDAPSRVKAMEVKKLR